MASSNPTNAGGGGGCPALSARAESTATFGDQSAHEYHGAHPLASRIFLDSLRAFDAPTKKKDRKQSAGSPAGRANGTPSMGRQYSSGRYRRSETMPLKATVPTEAKPKPAAITVTESESNGGKPPLESAHTVDAVDTVIDYGNDNHTTVGEEPISNNAMGSREVSQERDTRFSGYGAHVGSGIEFAPNRWSGGEVVTDPTFVTKSLKPKRFYYSPIGDGVVAADGVEMKYAPRSQEPRVTVVQQRTVERTAPGHAGVRVIEKTWSEGGAGYQGDKVTKLGETGGPPAEAAGGPASGQPQYGAHNGSNAGGHPPYTTQIPVVHQQAPVPATQSYASAPPTATPPQAQTAAARPMPPATSPKPQRYETPLDINTAPARSSVGQQPYGGAPASNYGGTAPPSNLTSPLGGGNRSYTGTPNSFKSFNTSSSLYEPGMRYEIKRDYMVSNPRELIHQYATTTPINTIPGAETTTQITRETYSSTVEETSIGPLPPYTAGAHVPNPNKFVRQLRDETMTSSQRNANKNQQSFVAPTDTFGEQKIEEIRRQTTSRHFSPNAEEVDSLTSRLVSGLNVGANKRY